MHLIRLKDHKVNQIGGINNNDREQETKPNADKNAGGQAQLLEIPESKSTVQDKNRVTATRQNFLISIAK